MSLSRFCPANMDDAGGGVGNSTRSGGKAQISEVRRVMPRSARVIGRLWPLGSTSVPGTVPRNCRLSIKVASGAWMLMWILSEEANSGFSAARDGVPARRPKKIASAADNRIFILSPSRHYAE